MASPLQNVWHLRTVAEASSKPCLICYKPTARVLITPEGKDFFYICVGHLNDKGFASPIIDAEAAAAKQKEEAKKREVEKVIKEYEEKQRKRKEKKKAKDDAKDKEEDNGKKKAKADADADADSKEEKERDEKIKSIENAAAASTNTELPRVYALHRNFYQMRLDRLRNVELAKKNQQRLKDPNVFPSAPKGDLQ